MIDSYGCVYHGDGFHTSLRLAFDSNGAICSPSIYPALSIFVSHLPSTPHGMYDARQFDESWINVEVPHFAPTQARKANQWLLAYASGVQAGLDAGNKPLIARPHPWAKPEEES